MQQGNSGQPVFDCQPLISLGIVLFLSASPPQAGRGAREGGKSAGRGHQEDFPRPMGWGGCSWGRTQGGSQHPWVQEQGVPSCPGLEGARSIPEVPKGAEQEQPPGTGR